MLKLIKWVCGLLITLPVLIMLAIFIVPKVFNPNEYRAQIISLVKQKTDRDLRLDGDLSVSIFPWLGVRTQGLAFSQPDQIGGDMIAVDSAQLRVKLLPLLSKKIEFDTVILDEPLLRIVTLENGVDSFIGLTDSGSGDSANKNDAAPDSNNDSGPSFRIEGLEIYNAQVVIDDRSEQQRYEVAGFNFKAGNLIGSSLADFNASGSLSDSSSPDEIEFELQGLAQIDVNSLDVQVVDLSLDVLMADDKITIDATQLALSSEQVLEVDDVTVSWVGAQKAKLHMPELLLDLGKQNAKISLITLTSGQLSATITNLEAAQIIDAPAVTGLLNVDAFNAQSVLNDFEVDYFPENKASLKSVSINTRFKATTESASLSSFKLMLDQSELAGSASVVNFDSPKLTFDLALDRLNLDDYLPKDEAQSSADEAQEQAASSADALAVPMSAFKDINANGHFVAQQLISAGLEFNDVDVTIKSSAGNVTITPKASLYEGKTDGVISFSETNGTSTLNIKNEIDLVSLGEMLVSADITDQLSGIGSLIVDVVVTEKDGVQSNEGTIKLVAKNGALKGVDIQNIIQKGYSSYRDLKGRSLTEEETTSLSGSGDETKFAELLGTFYLKDNKLSNDDFSLKAPLFRVGGQGDILLDAQTLDYRVDFSVVKSLSGQGGDAFDELKGLTIPIRLKGNLDAPSYSVDWSSLYKNIVKQRIDDEKAKLLKEKLGIDGGDKLSTKDVLKQLLLDKVNKDSAKDTVTPAESDSSSDEELTKEKSEEADKKSTKDELKDQLKNKLLESLFN